MPRLTPIRSDDLEDIVDVYREVFSAPPYLESEGDSIRFRLRLERALTEEGASSWAIRSDDDEVMGFACGATIKTGSWLWDDLGRCLPQGDLREWLIDCYEVRELAVSPRFRRQGIGTQLHTALMQRCDSSHALLLVRVDATDAVMFYAARGWRILIQDLILSDISPHRMVLGLALPANEA